MTVGKLISMNEFAQRLGGISIVTLHSWLRTGRFGLVKTKIGRRTMLQEAELLKVINAEAPRAKRRYESKGK